MYISKNAIPDLVAYKLNHPEYLFVSANVINHPRLQNVHNHFRVMLPFAPEQHPLRYPTKDWRVNHLPTSPLEDVRSMEQWLAPPEYKHRWLPMRGATIDNCPIRDALECSGRPQWECATIVHYTLFQHLENSTEPFLKSGG